ncbi:MAG: endonuclease/exonuclease/phosphatase family protein [Clostridia bacterium]|nr:endonuclease/exonuclease/phosphatase family protein [Clostridia bacterium]
MKFSLKFFTLCLTLLLVLLPLISCQSASTGNVGTTESSSNATTAMTTATPTTAPLPEGVEPLETPLVLCTAKESMITVTRPVTSQDAITNLVQTLLEAPKALGARQLQLKWSTDRSDPKGAELLLGYTNRPETKEVLASIGLDDYAIVRRGEHIVVAAHSASRLTEAVEFLCSHLLRVGKDSNGEPVLLYLGDYTFVSEKQNFLFTESNPLSAYSIVYKSSSPALTQAAQALQSALQEAYGVTLPLVDDSTAEVEQEILIGNVNRPLAKEQLGNKDASYALSSVLVSDGKKLLIGSVTDSMTRSAVQNFCEDYIVDLFSNTLILESDIQIIGTAHRFTEAVELTEGADLRIMSFNVLCELWDAKATDVESRMAIVMATLLSYSPDVVGLQEISDKCYQSLTPLFEGNYAFVDTKTERGLTNFSPLAYNVEKVTLLEHGVKTLASGNNPSLRVISWGYFERKSDGARFVVANTHWDLTRMPESRTKQAIEMGDFMVAMRAKYNCPVITTGDYNTQEYQEQFQTYLDHSQLLDAGLTAQVVNRNYKSTHTLFAEPTETPDVRAIDHVFYSPDIEALFYNMLVDKILLDASDHFPVYTDFKLN